MPDFRLPCLISGKKVKVFSCTEVLKLEIVSVFKCKHEITALGLDCSNNNNLVPNFNIPLKDTVHDQLGFDKDNPLWLTATTNGKFKMALLGIILAPVDMKSTLLHKV